jgi:hypothetical protein
MTSTPTIKNHKRNQDRSLTDASITCRPFTSDVAQASDGIMRNFSGTGSYIETSRGFKPGTVLIVRMTQYRAMSSSIAAEEGLRSISLAEVKWMQELADENTTRYVNNIRIISHFIQHLVDPISR